MTFLGLTALTLSQLGHSSNEIDSALAYSQNSPLSSLLSPLKILLSQVFVACAGTQIVDILLDALLIGARTNQQSIPLLSNDIVFQA